MPDPDAFISFSNLTKGELVTAFCSVCGKRFECRPEGKRMEDQIIAIRNEFDAHDCDAGDDTR